MTTPPGFRSLASKFFLSTASLVFWVVAVILGYDLRQGAFDIRKGVLLLVVVLLLAGAISRMTIRLLTRPLGPIHAAHLLSVIEEFAMSRDAPYESQTSA